MLKYLITLCLLALTACDSEQKPSASDLNSALGGIADAGFERALAPRAFHFPQDHAAHPAFRNEWWYVTGNLQTDAGQAFGYQVTLFRIALSPQAPTNDSAWASNQVWMAHVALTDVKAQQHLHDQRFARAAVGLAGQSTQPFRVWLEDWQMVGTANGEFPWSITVKTDDFNLNLLLQTDKPAILQGNHGLSQKSSAPGNASYYYSLTRLQTSGDIYRNGQRHVVYGESWLDREWSTSALGAEQAGWDWFSLQLTDGHELMFYRLRRKDGSADPHSAGKWILPDGGSETLDLQGITLRPLRYWKAASGASYPVAWQLDLAQQQRHLRVEALVDDQLMQTGVTYWEGAVRVVDSDSGKEIGRGYLELSGYE
ncbi:MAG: lipocalin-like domain-containing protein [Thiolinea sp.]